MSTEYLNELARAQDVKSDIELLRKAVSIESITGNEWRFTKFLQGQMEELGFATSTGKFDTNRENVWGSNDVNSSFPHLLFIGHTDTVHVRGWKEYWKEDPRSNPFAGVEHSGKIWGRGTCDLKGGICAILAAIRLLSKVGYKLDGRITLAFVGDEESGERNLGISAGIKDFIKRIDTGEVDRPNFAVYVEPTELNVYTAQIGFFIADITVTGKTAYFGRPEQGVDALKSAHRLLSNIWEHEVKLSYGPSHSLVGKSTILVTGINSGGYIAVPGKCHFSLIRTLRPGENLDQAVKIFESELLSGSQHEGIEINIEYPAGRDHPKGGSPVEIKQDLDAVIHLQESIRSELPDQGKIQGAPYWSETPFLVNKIKCPSVYCAPGDISVAHTFEEHIDIEEYLAAIRIYAQFTANYCGIKSSPTSSE